MANELWNIAKYSDTCTTFCFVGTVASIIDIGTIWMTDLKYGICLEAFWLDREQCCWSSPNQTTPHNNNCTEVTSVICCWFILCWNFNLLNFLCLPIPQWLTWPKLVGLSDDSAGGYIVAYISYTIWALSFTGLAVTLVRMFAPYASGGGIPEVNYSLTSSSSMWAQFLINQLEAFNKCLLIMYKHDE